jgi:predicted Fe-Mo cluster-binding NifX family protein
MDGNEWQQSDHEPYPSGKGGAPMKVAVSSTGTDLASTIDERFGRCRYFLIVETEDMSVEVIDNPNADMSTGAGIQSASLVADRGVSAVITGSCGPKAMQVFAAANVELVPGQRGVVEDVIQKFKAGQLDSPVRGNKAAAARGFGSAGTGGRGMGMGGGRGMGGGGRMGRCGRGGRGRGRT